MAVIIQWLLNSELCVCFPNNKMFSFLSIKWRLQLRLYADFCAWKAWTILILIEFRCHSIIPGISFVFEQIHCFLLKLRIYMSYLFTFYLMDTLTVYCAWWNKYTCPPNKIISASDVEGFVTFKLEAMFALKFFINRHCLWALIHSSGCRELAERCLIVISKTMEHDHHF